MNLRLMMFDELAEQKPVTSTSSVLSMCQFMIESKDTSVMYALVTWEVRELKDKEHPQDLAIKELLLD